MRLVSCPHAVGEYGAVYPTSRAMVMTTATATIPVIEHRTLADLLTGLGGISAARVRLQPFPGTATESDVIAVHARENRLCELVDGTLVDKVMGFDESIYAALILGALLEYLKTHDLGKIVGADGMMRIFPGVVRIPDTAFISWARYPKGKRRRGEIPLVVPDLIIEVLSEGNTPREMARKLDEYFRRSPLGLVRQSQETYHPRLHRKRSICPPPRRSHAGRRRCSAGFRALDPGLVRRSRAQFGTLRAPGVVAPLISLRRVRRALIEHQSVLGEPRLDTTDRIKMDERGDPHHDTPEQLAPVRRCQISIVEIMLLVAVFAVLFRRPGLTVPVASAFLFALAQRRDILRRETRVALGQIAMALFLPPILGFLGLHLWGSFGPARREAILGLRRAGVLPEVVRRPPLAHSGARSRPPDRGRPAVGRGAMWSLDIERIAMITSPIITLAMIGVLGLLATARRAWRIACLFIAAGISSLSTYGLFVLSVAGA